MEPGKRINLGVSDELRRKVDQSWQVTMCIYMFDTVIMAEMEKLLFRAKGVAVEHGLYRMEVKRDMNEVKRIIDRNRNTVSRKGIGSFLTAVYVMLPEASSRYTKMCAKPEEHLMSAFMCTSGDTMKKFEDESEQFAVNHGIDYPVMFGAMSMMLSLCFITKRVHEYQFSLIRGDYKASDLINREEGNAIETIEWNILQARANEPMFRKIDELMQRVIKNVGVNKMIRDDHGEQEKMVDMFYRLGNEIGGKAMMDAVNSAITTVIMEYTEFYLACLRMDMLEAGKVNASYRKTIADVIGDGHVDMMLDELSKVDPLREGEDLLDLAERIPEGEEDSALRMSRKEMRRRDSEPVEIH